jgi:hypothetical protein
MLLAVIVALAVSFRDVTAVTAAVRSEYWRELNVIYFQGNDGSESLTANPPLNGARVLSECEEELHPIENRLS